MHVVQWSFWVVTYSSSHCPCDNDQATQTLSYVHMRIITLNTCPHMVLIKSRAEVDYDVMHINRTVISDTGGNLEG